MSEAPEIRYSFREKDAGGFEIVVEDDGKVSNVFPSPAETALDAFHDAYRAAFAERERLGWPPGDPRIQFPERPGKAA